ncbi:hypothetical protein GOBAR_AA35133 [Gossypium barbadense]|uniref:Uncharacterized protein n=1 Tax=Gossypium barbadense TaxID=3634 RepID=A0A2P5W367_GOSBA|nr:hypothetical protein GOBAR_AA35133 [Gossypium barbadense]
MANDFPQNASSEDEGSRTKVDDDKLDCAHERRWLETINANGGQVLSDIRESVELWGGDGRKSNIDMERVTLLSIDNMGVNETVEVEVSNRDKEGECWQVQCQDGSDTSVGPFRWESRRKALKLGKIVGLSLQVDGDEDGVLRDLAAIELALKKV